MRIRVVPTASKKNAIQVVSKRNGKLTVHKHIGSFSTYGEKAQLVKKAEQFITDTSGQSSLMDLLNSVRPTDLQITRSRPLFVYQLLGNMYDKLGFNGYLPSISSKQAQVEVSDYRSFVKLQ